jgi:hypothetical protein
MKAGYAKLARSIARIEARVLANGDAMQFPIPRHSGMAGLRAAIEAAKAARGSDEREPKAGRPRGPIQALREALLQEQARRAELFAIMPIEKLCEQPAIYETEEPEKCDTPTPSPNA